MSTSLLTPMVMPAVNNAERRNAALTVCDVTGERGNPSTVTDILAMLGLIEQVDDGTWWPRGPVEDGQLWDGTYVPE